MTMKKEWDSYCRSAGTKAFPMSLASMYMPSKQDLFELWLDGNRHWPNVELAVKRRAEQQNLNRKQWQAVKGRQILADVGEERWAQIKQSRVDNGLYYKDTDFPDDELDPLLCKANPCFLVLDSYR